MKIKIVKKTNDSDCQKLLQKLPSGAWHTLWMDCAGAPDST